ncbi:hypothetical protein [Sulfitobacter sp.]|uniref:hypothetical protein n=1 Tax=Sulfitobacter sp. TaxID=1903071 RepID=UPI003EF98B43
MPFFSRESFGFGSFSKSLVSLLSITAVVVVACDLPKEVEPPAPPEKPIVREFSNPGADTACPCETSRGVYLRNRSDTARSVSYSIFPRDTISGEQVNPQSSQINISEAGTANDRQFVGCTIYAPDTSCRFDAQYRVGPVSTPRATPVALKSLLGPQSAPSLATCMAWCDPNGSDIDPNSGSCLTLGKRFHKAIAPMNELLSQAQPGIPIPQKDVMAAYGLNSSDDTCKRGPTETVGETIRNTGVENSCEIRSADLPESVLRVLGFTQKDLDPLNMTSRIPQELEATGVATQKMMGRGLRDVYDFPFYDTAPSLRFGGVDGEFLTKLYGGNVLASATVDTPGIGLQTIIATVNGCISVDQ